MPYLTPRSATELKELPGRVGLDIDGVLANFTTGFLAAAAAKGLPAIEHWTEWSSWSMPFDWAFMDVFGPLMDDADFWLGLPTYDDAFVDFQPALYCTARPIDSDVTEAWLAMNGFPKAPVITVKSGSKLPHLAGKVDLFVDDKQATYEELNAGGLECLLRLRPHNLAAPEPHKHINYLTQVAPYAERLALRLAA